MKMSDAPRALLDKCLMLVLHNVVLDSQALALDRARECNNATEYCNVYKEYAMISEYFQGQCFMEERNGAVDLRWIGTWRGPW